MVFDLLSHGITVKNVDRNPCVPRLYELGLQEPGCTIADTGALIAYSGAKTGRSPLEKRVVEEELHREDVWWGSINIPISEEGFAINKETAIDFLNSRPHLFCVDGFAGWDTRHRIKMRVICARAYHALFMHNMLIRPTAEELENFGEPDWVIYNSGQFPANSHTPSVTKKTSINLNIKTRELVILGTEYAGEMKKGIFTILNYLLPKAGALSMHCSANEGPDGDVALFFGLSGTGKTTLSADPKRRLIGDDEHGWTDDGIFNFEGGCYAKVIRLSKEGEPDIWKAIRFGTVLENVVYDEQTHVVDYYDGSITENTRASYPIEHMANAKIPGVGSHPRNIIFLTCDAFGV
ncbi:MAG TPA: phosphoenolpyruvate carboxykinase (ATP), partial [bacterium]|nr:phosphoenolpyruvate carboxykinase (ATP) [bacterium]